MKKSVYKICIVLCIISMLVVSVNAQEDGTFSSPFFASYDSCIEVITGTTSIEIWFDVVGNGAMDEIGVSEIELERSRDGRDWTVVKTFLPEDYPQMICRNTGIAYDYVPYTGDSGYVYRAYVTYHARNSRGLGIEYQYSESVYVVVIPGFN